MISVAIATHQDRIKWYIHIIKKLYDVVDEFIVLEDNPTDLIYQKAEEALKGLKKVVHLRNQDLGFTENQGPFKNKLQAVALCHSEYVAILDSDNQFGVKFIDAFKKAALHTMPGNVVYCPQKALPRFDFSKYTGQVFSLNNAGYFMKDGPFQVLMNTGNYIVRRDKYFEILKPLHNEKIPHCCDVIYANYHILKAGGTMCVVDGMKYGHLDHPGSTYRQNVGKEPEETLKWQNMVRTLK
jgi:glycosyltransferase involved in cell wall biosynthesis